MQGRLLVECPRLSPRPPSTGYLDLLLVGARAGAGLSPQLGGSRLSAGSPLSRVSPSYPLLGVPVFSSPWCPRLNRPS